MVGTLFPQLFSSRFSTVSAVAVAASNFVAMAAAMHINKTKIAAEWRTIVLGTERRWNLCVPQSVWVGGRGRRHLLLLQYCCCSENNRNYSKQARKLFAFMVGYIRICASEIVCAGCLRGVVFVCGIAVLLL